MSQLLSRSTVGVVLLIVFGLTVATLPAVADGPDDGFVFVSADTTPEQPTTEGNFTLGVTLRSAASSADNPLITAIAVRNGRSSGSKGYTSVDYFDDRAPRIGPNNTYRHNFSVDLDEPGRHDLYLHIHMRDLDGQTFTVVHRVEVSVYQPHPGLDASLPPTNVGKRATLGIRVANGYDGPIRNVELTARSGELNLDRNRQVASSIAAGETFTFNFTTSSDSPGLKPIDATLTYSTPNGTRRRVTRELSVRYGTARRNGNIGLAATVEPTMPGSETNLSVDVTNGLDVDLRQLSVSLAADGARIDDPRRTSGQLTSGQTRTFTYEAAKPAAGPQPVAVTIEYTTVDGVHREFTRILRTTFEKPANPGAIQLTGLQIQAEESSVRISGSAANTGSTDVTAVLVRVGSAENVEPSTEGAEYFVGSVGSGDFASFEIAARLTRNASQVEIPLHVEYVVDGVRKERTTTVSFRPNPTPSVSRSKQGSLPVGALVGGLAGIGIMGIVGWRRYYAGD